MIDCILPIGQTCNITFLLQNAKIKRHTTLFEWFVSPNLIDITNILNKIANNTDDDIIKQKGNTIYIGDNIESNHYTYENFKLIYQRRRNRLLNIILSSKKILFCRFEGTPITYCKEDIDNFIKTVLSINENLEDIKLMLITPDLEFEHPSVIKVWYDKHKDDPYCKSKEINDLFTNTLHTLGYDIKDTVDTMFTDMSDL